MQCRYALVFLALFAWAISARADRYLRDNYRDTRWLGRGNTGVATVNDASAVFYNPAGLAFAQSYKLTIFNPSFGANQNFKGSAKELSNISSGGSLSDKFEPFLGKPLGVNANIFPSISIPGFALGFWDYLETNAEYRNPVNPEFTMDYRNDYGLALAGAVNATPELAFGLSLRYQKRTSADVRLTGGVVLQTQASGLKDYQHSGTGWGLNLGTQYRHKVNAFNWISLGAAIEDLGDTRFRNQHLGEQSPPTQSMFVNTGLAYGVSSRLADVTFLWDMRQLNNADLSTTKKIFLGTELNLPIVDLRGGFFQGYWTAGASLKILPFFDVDLTTYGEELDSAAGIRQNRMWLLSLRSGLELKKSAKKKQRFTLDNL